MSDRLENILDKLQRVRKQGGQYVARCPAHKDKSPSLSVTERNGTILVHCHAGCSADSIRKALDLEWSAFFPDGYYAKTEQRFDRRSLELEALMARDRLQTESAVLEEINAKRGWSAATLYRLGVGWNGERLTLPVHDKAGKLHDVLRYDAIRKSKLKMLQGKGRSRYPWPAPEKIDTYGSRHLYIVEGEGTALSLWSLGLPAVALPGSIARASGSFTRPSSFAGNGWHPSWAERFRMHKRIVLIPDCNTVGRTLMTAVAYDLGNAGASITTVDLDPERDDGRDIGDWAKPFTTDRLRRLARDLVVMLVDVAARRPDQLDEAREVFVGFSRFNYVPMKKESGDLWDWRTG